MPIRAVALAKPSGLAWSCAALIMLVLLGERLLSGVRAARDFRDRAGWLFPLVHLARDVTWVGAMVMWTVRRAAARPLSASP